MCVGGGLGVDFKLGGPAESVELKEGEGREGGVEVRTVRLSIRFM